VRFGYYGLVEMRKPLAKLIGLAALLASQNALACVYSAPPRIRVLDDFDVIVVGTVTSGGYTGERRPDYHPWRAAAHLKLSLQGTPEASDFEFDRSGSTAACDDGQPPPVVGEDWVLYLKRNRGRLEVFESYPLSWAAANDPRFQTVRGRIADLLGSTGLGLILAFVALGAAVILLRRRQRLRHHRHEK
jgi:hypothetical protein